LRDLDARAQVDFCVNSWALGLLALAVALGQCLWSLSPLAGATKFQPGSLVVAAFAVLVIVLAYAMATKLVVTWGDFVKAAFDLYLPALAKQMGYKLPPTGDARREFWDEANSSFLYWSPIDPARWPAADGDDEQGDADASAKKSEEEEETG
jgi:hypothetical protein